MNHSSLKMRLLTLYVAILTGFWSMPSPCQAATLTDFGFQRKQTNGHLSIGQRSLVVIMAEFAAVTITSIDGPAQIHISANATLTASNLPIAVRRSGTIVATLTGGMINGSNIVSVNSTTGIQINDQISDSENNTVGNIQPVAPFTHSAAYFDSLIFDPTHPLTSQSVNSYYLENSNGRFIWTRAGIIGPIRFPASQRRFTYPGADRSSAYYSNMIASAMQSGFNFQQYDSNADGEITPDELQIMIITNDSDVANRDAGFTKPAGFTYGIRAWQVAALSDLNDFASRCHELCHGIGAQDLYGAGGLSQNLTLMGATLGGPPNNTTTYHLDPWHKMQFGWSEPRIRSIRTGGVETIAAAQMLQPDAPIIYYDPIRGTNEFFIFEYRTASSPNGGGYDTQVAGNGLVVWHVQQNSSHDIFAVPSLTVPQGTDNTVWAEGPPSFGRGSNSVWTAASPSAYLKWADGTQTSTRFVVRPFNFGDGSIIVEAHAEYDSWVDFAYPGAPFFSENGEFATPFNTLQEGVAGVGYGGFLNFKSGTSAATGTITKPMTLRSYGGQVTIGR